MWHAIYGKPLAVDYCGGRSVESSVPWVSSRSCRFDCDPIYKRMLEVQYILRGHNGPV